MTQEILVLFACLNSTGCSETSGAYYRSHPEFREMILKTEKKVKNYTGPIFFETISPILLITAGGTGSVNLPYGFSLRTNTKESFLIFQKGF